MFLDKKEKFRRIHRWTWRKWFIHRRLNECIEWYCCISRHVPIPKLIQNFWVWYIPTFEDMFFFRLPSGKSQERLQKDLFAQFFSNLYVLICTVCHLLVTLTGEYPRTSVCGFFVLLYHALNMERITKGKLVLNI